MWKEIDQEPAARKGSRGTYTTGETPVKVKGWDRLTKILTFNWMIIKHCLSPHYQDSSMLTVDCSWKSCKTQTLWRGGVEKPNSKRESKTKDHRGIWRLAHRATANMKHSPKPSHININAYTKGLFTSVSITWCNMSDFQKIITRQEKTQSEEQSNYQNRIWHRCWNYQTGNLK